MIGLRAAQLFWDIRAGFGGGGSSSGGGGGGGFSGGSSGGSGSGDLSWSGFAMVLVLVIVANVVADRWKRRSKRRRTARERADEARLWSRVTSIDPRLDEATTEGYVREAFETLNDAWSRLDAAAMAPLLTPQLHDKMSSMVEALARMHRRNVVSDIDVRQLELEQVNTDDGGHVTGFTVHVVADTVDELLDDRDGRRLVRSTSGADEHWTFVADEGAWRLAGIAQSTHSLAHDEARIANFARDHHLHYSADFGRLLLPERGVLFGGASLATSDVNNHVIGHLDGTLVQLYTYVRTPRGVAADQVVVAQTVLEREVSDILVRRRDATRWSGASGLREFEFESEAFNDEWRVHATEEDELAAFELLNPAFLERMTQVDVPIGIEAVGSSLYLFDESGTATYDLMFELLADAHRELRR